MRRFWREPFVDSRPRGRVQWGGAAERRSICQTVSDESARACRPAPPACATHDPWVGSRHVRISAPSARGRGLRRWGARWRRCIWRRLPVMKTASVSPTQRPTPLRSGGGARRRRSSSLQRDAAPHPGQTSVARARGNLRRRIHGGLQFGENPSVPLDEGRLQGRRWLERSLAARGSDPFAPRGDGHVSTLERTSRPKPGVGTNLFGIVGDASESPGFCRATNLSFSPKSSPRPRSIRVDHRGRERTHLSSKSRENLNICREKRTTSSLCKCQ